jgi:hypothetical protein
MYVQFAVQKPQLCMITGSDRSLIYRYKTNERFSATEGVAINAHAVTSALQSFVASPGDINASQAAWP